MEIKFRAIYSIFPLGSASKNPKHLLFSSLPELYFNALDLIKMHFILGKKDHPLSPYTFDRPEVEKSVQRVLRTPENSDNTTRPPSWFNEINSRVIKHDGEAPLFMDNFLPSNKV